MKGIFKNHFLQMLLIRKQMKTEFHFQKHCIQFYRYLEKISEMVRKEGGVIILFCEVNLCNF